MLFYSVSSSFLFLLLPKVESSEEGEEITIKNEVSKIMNILKDKKYIYLNIYMFFPGVTIGFYASFLSTLVSESLPQ